MGIMADKTVVAAGVTWRVADVRYWEDRDNPRRKVAWVQPVDAETGEELQTVKIGRVVRDASFMQVVANHYEGGVTVYNDLNLTPAAYELLRGELEPILAEYAAPLTRAECLQQITDCVTKYGVTGVKQAMRGYSGTYAQRGTREAGGHNLLALEPAEIAQLREAWSGVFDQILADIASVN